jgi:hypothetical protein
MLDAQSPTCVAERTNVKDMDGGTVEALMLLMVMERRLKSEMVDVEG